MGSLPLAPTWVLSNIKLPSDFHGSKSLPLSMPQSLLCARGGGVFFLSYSDSSRIGGGVSGAGWPEGSSGSHFAQPVLSEGCSQLPGSSAWIAIRVLWAGIRQCVCGHLLWVPVHWLQGGALPLTSTAHHPRPAPEDSPCGSGFMLEGFVHLLLHSYPQRHSDEFPQV